MAKSTNYVDAAIMSTQTTSTSLPPGAQLLGTVDCYENVFKEITKNLYENESKVQLADVIENSTVSTEDPTVGSIVYDASEFFRQETISGVGTNDNRFAIISATGATTSLPAGTILEGNGRMWRLEGVPTSNEQINFSTISTPNPATTVEIDSITSGHPQEQLLAQTATIQLQDPMLFAKTKQQRQPIPLQEQSLLSFEERWFESDESLPWTQSKIARYNPAQKVFRCVDCDFVGFLSRLAEHWLGNHADLRVFKCPRCPYTSAWARCVRMHLTRQHGETHTDNSLWKENPVLEEVTKFLTTLKTKVEQKAEPVNPNGDKRYMCPYCPYQSDRRDLYNRHENIHRDEKPFHCYVCDKQFNRADHVKKHFIRMHREFNYDTNQIRKFSTKTDQSSSSSDGKIKVNSKSYRRQPPQQMETHSSGVLGILQKDQTSTMKDSVAVFTIQENSDLSRVAYSNSPSAQTPTVRIEGNRTVGNGKREGKTKGNKRKKLDEKMYTCSYCPWQGVDNWCLKRHLNTHIKPFLCALCDYKAARSERLATHVLKVHNKRVCHRCSFHADDTASLNQHIKESHQNPLIKTGFNCNICQEYFELRADLESHAILEHQKVIVQCDLCDFRTTDELSMESHLRDKHNLTPGMGAVAAAAAAAMLQASPKIELTEIDNTRLQTQTVLAEMNMNHNLVVNSKSNHLQSEILNQNSPKVNGNSKLDTGSLDDSSEPETLCDKCGIDFIDEKARQLHERRHELVQPSEEEAIKSKSGVRRLIRNYVCSTCSYTCATKNIMMQHQRAHNGFDLECKAGGCQFTTPFENTLKEHINSEHCQDQDNNSNTRCPHCGHQILSKEDFSSHVSHHHRTICSLCVNIYRNKYDVKEVEIHDVISKTPNRVVNDTSVSNNNSNDIVDSRPTACSGSKLFKREGIRILPRISEVVVTRCNIDHRTLPGHLLSLGKKKSSNLIYNKKRFDELKNMNSLDVTVSKPEKVLKVPFRRRYCQKGTYSWVYRNIRDGFKCFNPLCENRRSCRYPRKIGLVLHKQWYHLISRFKCDTCGVGFPHMYKAVLHNILEHSECLDQ